MAASNPRDQDPSIESRITVHRYGNEHILQYYEVFQPATVGEDKNAAFDKDKVWIVYIHGGAWRDPLITSSSFIPFLKSLYPSQSSASSSSPISHIAGIASLSYRLSPHPSHPQDPSQTPDHNLRNAKHPQHIEDVVSAIADLQGRYNFGNQYVIVGHSCGATLAFQVAMYAGVPWKSSGGGVYGDRKEEEAKMRCQLPVAIVGVEGIYGVDLLLRDYKDVSSAYREFVEAAFGDSRDAWIAVSPAQRAYERYVCSWADNIDEKGEGRRKGKVLALLAHSHEDELVNMAQSDEMARVLKGEKRGLGQSQFRGTAEAEKEEEKAENGEPGGENVIEYRFLELKGRHHEIWEKGEEMARCVTEAVKALYPESGG
ncbi:MAG: hypothetical protein Q9160_004904 [Pyrenula sp. 1 TL-2023]